MRIHLLSKGPPDQTSGGYLYNRYLIQYLKKQGLEVEYHPDTCRLSEIEANDILIVDGLVVAESAAQLLAISATLILLMHTVPDLGQLPARRAAVLESLYRRARIVVTGDASLDQLSDRVSDVALGFAKIEPGVPQAWRSKGHYPPKPRRLISVANYVRGKGISRLLDVLRQLTDLSWTMTVYGNRSLDPEYHELVTDKLHRYGLAGRVDLAGPVGHRQINETMVRSDLLVHLSGYESYSMAKAEAIVSGLPVLSYPTGNAADFERSGLVQHIRCAGASDVETLRALIEDANAYARLRPRARREWRTPEHMGHEFLAYLMEDR